MKNCIICNNLHYGRGKTCCLFCKAQLLSLSAKGKSGGYREGSGRAKTGYYKGIYCGSTYELVWVIYQLDHGIDFSRFNGYLEYNGKKYFPDFIQAGRIIEIKGYESQESVDLKNEVAKQNGYDVTVLRKSDLSDMFTWVSTKYGKDFKSLYDDYKPKFVYACAQCNCEIHRDKKSKYEKTYCSRTCSLRGNRISSGKNKFTPVV